MGKLEIKNRNIIGDKKMALIKTTTKTITKVKNIDLLEKIPNAETIETIKNIEKGIGLHEVANVEELFKELRA